MDESVRLNDIYVTKNLVAGYIDNEITKITEGSTENDTASISDKSKESTMEDKPPLEIKEFEKKFDYEDKLRKNLLLVNQYILYERNISFFFNYVIQKLIKAYNN